MTCLMNELLMKAMNISALAGEWEPETLSAG